MRRLLEKIYKDVIYLEDDVVRMEKELAAEIDELLTPYIGKYSEKEITEFKATIYEAIFAAEAKAFWLGVRYAYRMSKLL